MDHSNALNELGEEKMDKRESREQCIQTYNHTELKILFLVVECPGRQVKSALITNVRDSIKHEESKWFQWTND